MDIERPRDKTPIRPKEPEPTPAEKPQSSSFDRILEQSRALQRSPLLQQQSTRQGSEEAQRETQRRGRAHERRETMHRRERARAIAHHEAETTERTEEGPQHRVVLKTQLKREQGGSSQGGAHGSFGQSGEGAREKTAATGRSRQDLRASLVQQLEQGFGAALQSHKVPTAFTTKQLQQLVNQLVQFVRVGRTTVEGTELQLGMNETVFRGLRLRLTAKDGKVTVQFQSSHADVRALFEREREKITRALEAKGVRVGAIHIEGG